MTALLLSLLLAAAEPPAGGLAAFAPVLGRCWEGKVGLGAIDVHCFEPVYRGAHVRDRHRVWLNGKIVYEGETLYSREGGRVTFVYLNSQGGAGHGEATPDARGICFSLAMRATPDAAPQDSASCWRWQSGGGYLVSSPTAPDVRFVLSKLRA
jgi:hypothetical protein